MAAHGTEKTQLDRRALIKKAGAGAAIAWAAPTVLASTAGAQATTCYFVKRESAVYEFSDGSCGIPESAYPEPVGLSYSISFSDTSATATVSSPGCYIQSVQLKTGGPQADQCKTPVPGGTNTTTMTVTNPVQQAISHVNMIFCCTSSGSI